MFLRAIPFVVVFLVAICTGINNTCTENDPKFASDTTAYVLCLKRDASAGPTDKPTWDWLYDESGSKTVEIEGKWTKTKCYGEDKDTFTVQCSKFKEVLDACKEKGFEIAQPAKSKFSGYYPFQAGTIVFEYFSDAYKRIRAVNCGSAHAKAADTTTGIYCVKGSVGLISSKPEIQWLKDDDGNDVTIPGTWTTASCTYGTADAFVPDLRKYNQVSEKCKKLGFELAQPGDSSFSGWSTFKIGDDLAAYYRSTWTAYERREKVPAERC